MAAARKKIGRSLTIVEDARGEVGGEAGTKKNFTKAAVPGGGAAVLRKTLDRRSHKADSLAKRGVVERFGGFSRIGYAPYNPLKQNQDRMFSKREEKTGAFLFGVFDGHGEDGSKVTEFVLERLDKAVFGHSQWPSNPATVLRDSLQQIEKLLLADDRIETEFSGTTAVLGSIINGMLTVVNVGDSRLICGTTERRELVAHEITHDHKPDLPGEKKRILATGGRVFAVEYSDGIDGPSRVWLGHMDVPGLAMSRSLGDQIAHTAGVISTPDVYKRQLLPEDKILVMATDGLWEFMSNQEVMDMAAKIEDPEAACRELAADAYKRWMKAETVVDDTTVVVVHLDV